jgi:hypothetical protein
MVVQNFKTVKTRYVEAQSTVNSNAGKKIRFEWFKIRIEDFSFKILSQITLLEEKTLGPLIF